MLKRVVLSRTFASKKSIEKTVGFEFAGNRRDSALNERGKFEDEPFYGILRVKYGTY